MNNDFQQQLNKISRDKTDVLKEQTERVISECHQKAMFEYECIKKKILQEASNGNYTKGYNKKIITCKYNPTFTPCTIFYDDGNHHEIAGIFCKKLKITNTGIKKYTPREPEKWDYYIKELKRLANQDNISINPAIYYDDKLLCSFPGSFNEKRYVFMGSLCFECYVEF